MKSFMFCLLSLVLLASCGKDNESGKSGSYSNPYYNNQYGTINSPYSYGGIGVNQVINENPCLTNGHPNQMRVQVQQPVTLPNMNMMQPNDIYVGVTSSGDVGVLVGQGGSNAMFVGYLCNRGVMFHQGTQPLITGVNYGSSTRCALKVITATTLILPTGYTPVQLNFRWLDGGRSHPFKQPFSFCNGSI